jgi:hypothetical protein
MSTSPHAATFPQSPTASVPVDLELPGFDLLPYPGEANSLPLRVAVGRTDEHVDVDHVAPTVASDPDCCYEITGGALASSCWRAQRPSQGLRVERLRGRWRGDLETAARRFEAAEKARDAAVATLERAAARGGSPGGKR